MKKKSLTKLLAVYFGGILLSVIILSVVTARAFLQISSVNQEVRKENAYISKLYE